MPPKRTLPTRLAPNTAKQKSSNPPPVASSHPAPAPLSDAGTDSHSVAPSQQGDEDMATLGQILESMMKVSKNRRSRLRNEIEVGYRDEIAVKEWAARAWVKKIAIRKKREQIETLVKLKKLLLRKKEIEEDILAALEGLEGACEDLGEMLRRHVRVPKEESGSLNIGEKSIAEYGA